jgi:hypothetical protein
LPPSFWGKKVLKQYLLEKPTQFKRCRSTLAVASFTVMRTQQFFFNRTYSEKNEGQKIFDSISRQSFEGRKSTFSIYDCFSELFSDLLIL